VGQYQNVKQFWVLLQHETMEVVAMTTLESCSQITTISTSTFCFYRLDTLYVTQPKVLNY